MKTKITITIDDHEHEFETDCVKNWADIVCSFKRSGLGGVVRSFTSKFDFVGEAYDLLLNLFLRDRYNAQAKVSIYGLGNRWQWELIFTCSLDFSTKSIANGVFTINAIDNSLSALIKANKNVSYEFAIGTEIKPDGVFRFDRLPMEESITYAFTMGTSEAEGALSLNYTPCEDGSRRMWVGNIAEEVVIGRTVAWNDDQRDERAGYILKAVKDVDINIDCTLEIDERYNEGIPMAVNLAQIGSSSRTLSLGVLGGDAKEVDCGEHSSLADLETQYPATSINTTSTLHLAIVNGVIYELQYMGNWRTTNKTPDEYFAKHSHVTDTFSLRAGDKLVINGGTAAARARILNSRFVFSWNATGEEMSIEAFEPKTIAKSLLNRIGAGKIRINPIISSHDERINKTIMIAAESIRDFDGRKLTTSLNDFADWLEVVFGYTYTIGEIRKSKFKASPIEVVGRTNTPYPLGDRCSIVDYVLYSDHQRAFICFGRNSVGESGSFFRSWPNSNKYNDGELARQDRVFIINGCNYYFDIEVCDLVIYDDNIEDYLLDVQDIHFVHRSELFDSNIVKSFTDVKDLSNATDSSYICSSVEIGYEKRDYDKINGRDEWNFFNTYSTGCAVSESKMTLKCKYRCDCYGIEFAAQKRGEQTTNDSDSGIFFIYCNRVGDIYECDRDTYQVECANSDRVFNGAYSPRQCVLANAGVIGMQDNPLNLQFTAATGNSNIRINGTSLADNITLTTPLAMSETIEFSTNDLTVPDNLNGLIEVIADAIRYVGYITEISVKYVKESAVKYKILLKEISLCS